MHQGRCAFLVGSLKVMHSLIFAAESCIAKGELDWGNVFLFRRPLNLAEIPLQHGLKPPPVEGALHFVGAVLIPPKQQRTLPFFHSFGFMGTLMLTVMTGMGAVYYPNPRDGKTIGEIIRKHSVSFVISTPTFLRTFAHKP